VEQTIIKSESFLEGISMPLVSEEVEWMDARVPNTASIGKVLRK
jgi:hypothetical protein